LATTVPAPLEQAIQNASKQYNIPPDIMEGIWREEPGSTYPNPAVNSLGYGGLFGTKEWNASTQQQANYSASILHNLLVSTGGGIAPALSKYSGGGYTSVPGETTFGTAPGYGKGGGGFVSEVTSVGSDILSSGGNPVTALTNTLTGGGGGGGVFGGITSGIDSLILRGFFILIGLGLILVGLGLIAWQMMGRVGAPGIVGMAQTQMRISQSGARTAESQRASMVRESQAGERLGEQREARKLRERRLDVHQRGTERSGFEDRRFTNVRRDDRTVSKKKPGKRASGPPR